MNSKADIFDAVAATNARIAFEPDTPLFADLPRATQSGLSSAPILILSLVVIVGIWLLRRKVLATFRWFLVRINPVKIILVVAVIVFLYSTLNPPWRITVKDSKGHTKRTELVWSYIGYAPKAYGETYQSSAIALDVFLLQTICVLVSAAAAIWLVRPTPKPTPNSKLPSAAQRAQVAAELRTLPGAAEDLQTMNQAPAKHPSPSSN